jgi:D-alanyl-D-alanine carboxypeptidase
MLLKVRLSLMGFVILFLLGSCSPPAESQTLPPSTNTPVLNVPTPTKTPLPLTDTPVLNTSTPTQTPLILTDTPTLSTPTPIPTMPSPTGQSSNGISEVVAVVEELATQDQFSGAVLIARGSEVVWEYANGLADREADIPNRVDTKFNLGSMNKMFTAVAILQLMEQNKLSLDDNIAKHIPDYPNTKVANQVTIHQLLTHTSGLGDVFTDVFGADPNQFRSNEDYLPLFVNEPLQFIPGQEFFYSNAGYVVLGLMIEALSGQSYDDYVRLNIFEPSGMVNTDSYNIEDDIPNLAIGYTTFDFYGNETGVLARNAALMPGKGFAAGGGYSTVEDLFMFHDALFGYQLLSPASTDLLITGKVEVRENTRYAYGFFDKVEAGYRMVGHTGGAPGVCSFLSMYLDTGYTVVVLSNSDRDCAAVLTFLRNNPLQ